MIQFHKYRWDTDDFFLGSYTNPFSIEMLDYTLYSYPEPLTIVSSGTYGLLVFNNNSECYIKDVDGNIIYTLDDNMFILDFIYSKTIGGTGFDPATDPLYDHLNDMTTELPMDKLLAVLYQFDCEKNKVNKSTNLKTIGGFEYVIKSQSSIIEPSIMISYDGVIDFTYVYLQEFKRYYYVTNIVSIRNNIWQIDLKVDVLYTFKDDIIGQNAFVSRCESTTYANSGLVDKRVPIKDVPTITYTIPTSGLLVDTTIVNNNFKYVLQAFDQDSVTMDLTSKSIAPLGTSLPTIYHGYSDNPITKMYCLSASDYADLATDIRQNSSHANYIASILAIPFDISSDYKSATPESVIKLGTSTIPVTDTYELKGESSGYHVIADFTYSGANTGYLSFLNYEPFTTYEIFIPYHGWVKLNAKDFLGKRILVYFALDYSTGNGMVYISQYTTGHIIYSGIVQLGVKVGITTTNIHEINVQKSNNIMNMLLGVVGLGVGVSTGNPVAVTGGVISATKSVVNAVNQNALLQVSPQTTISGDRTGMYTELSVVVKKTEHSLVSSTLTTFRKLNGYPSNLFMALASGMGYTEIPEMHYEPSSQKYITSPEIDEIVALAKDGIIL